MPGPAIHHIVAKEVTKMLKEKLDPSFHPFLDKLDGEFASAFLLGAQGPDFLFFNTKDINPALKRFIDLFLDITDFIEDIKKQIIAIIPQELKDAVDTLEEVYDDIEARSSTLQEISQLVNEAENLLDLLTSTITMKLEQFITDNVEIFELLKNPIQDGQNFNEWWWFDTLHYRRTGKFAQTLLENSTPGTLEHAYALGYLTHFSADIVGHPFVNIVSGGPYRTHPKRHKLIENHQDVKAYKDYTSGDEFIQSRLGEEYIINGNDRELPAGLNKLILKSIEKVYFKNGRSLYGTEMNPDDLNDAYRLWLMWFRKSTNALDLPRPEPYSFTDEMEDIWNQLVENFEDLGSSIADGFSGDAGVLGVLKAIATAILAPFLAAAAIIDALIATLTTLTAAPIRFLISLAYDELYNAYMNLHQGVVLNGFGFPFNSQLSYYIIQHVFNTGAPDTLSHNAFSLINYYPTTKFKLEGMECESHLIYPLPDAMFAEKDKCVGAAKVYYGADFSRYMFGPIEFNRDRYEAFKNFIEKSAGDHEADTNSKFNNLSTLAHQESLGSAVDLSSILYQDFLNGEKLVDFNLDADKGIGFKAWRKVKEFDDINDEGEPHVPVTPEETTLNVQTDIIAPSNVIL